MPRFLVRPEDIRGESFTLAGSEARHAALVLRKKVGDVIDLFDGKDLCYQGRIGTIAEDRIEGQIVSRKAPSSSTSIPLTLCQALIKGPKWDWLVEKASEIGVMKLVPISTARTVVKPSSPMALERWKRIALAAAKQCGRNDVMEIAEPQAFSDAMKNLPKDGLALIPWEKERENTIRKALESNPSPHPSPLAEGRGRRSPGEGSVSLFLFIGPEGGWEASEVDLAIRHGVVPVTLGPTLLRSETAGLVAATLVLSELGGYA